VSKVLLDTNTYSLFKRNQSEDTKKILEFASEVGLPSVVVAELYAGFFDGIRFLENQSELELFLGESFVSMIRISDATLKIFGEQKTKLKRIGISVPHNDLWIASLAIEHNFVVYSLDKHLSLIPSITVIQSLADFLDL
jgi:tRNA(fMet)-specific endonuclease VapC